VFIEQMNDDDDDEVNKSSFALSDAFFLQFAYFLMFLNMQTDLIILKAYDQQFTLTTKKSLHIIFKWEICCT